MTSVQVFDLIKTRFALTSDYKLAKKLCISTASISQHRKHPHGLGEVTAYKAAKLLNIPPAYLLVLANIERATLPEIAATWRALATAIEAEMAAQNQRVERGSERRGQGRLCF